jgi:ParB-like chromosome segregation protein Spo0J
MAKKPSKPVPVPKLNGTSRVISVDLLRENPKNPNRQSKFIFSKMLDSIREFGFVDPVDVRSGDQNGPFKDGQYEVIGGHHRLKAAIALGMAEVPVNDLGNLSDIVANRLLIVLNETRGAADQDALAALVRDIREEGGDEAIQVLPFTDAQLADLLDDLGDAHVDEDDTEDEEADDSRKLKAADVAALLEMAGMSQADLTKFFTSIRKWSHGRDDVSTPAWEDLQKLMLENTPE